MSQSVEGSDPQITQQPNAGWWSSIYSITSYLASPKKRIKAEYDSADTDNKENVPQNISKPLFGVRACTNSV